MEFLTVDLVISALLAVTILYSWRLNRKIATLHEDRAELIEVLGVFNDSVQKAEGHINELKTLSAETDEQLLEHINKARFLANDLSFLMEKGEVVADTLEHYIKRVKPTTRAAYGAVPTSGRASDAAPVEPASPKKQKMVKELLQQISNYKKTQKAKKEKPPKAAAEPKQAVDTKAKQDAAEASAAYATTEKAMPQPAFREPKPFVNMPQSPSKTRRAVKELQEQAELANKQVQQKIDT